MTSILCNNWKLWKLSCCTWNFCSLHRHYLWGGRPKPSSLKLRFHPNPKFKHMNNNFTFDNCSSTKFLIESQKVPRSWTFCLERHKNNKNITPDNFSSKTGTQQFKLLERYSYRHKINSIQRMLKDYILSIGNITHIVSRTWLLEEERRREFEKLTLLKFTATLNWRSVA